MGDEGKAEKQGKIRERRELSGRILVAFHNWIGELGDSTNKQ
jgi:hypothetical protein